MATSFDPRLKEYSLGSWPLSRKIDARLVLALEIALAAILAFLLLGAKSFWLDEALSVSIAKLSWSDAFDLMSQHEGNMSLYYVILHVWLYFGESQFFVRTLSALFAIASVPVFYALGAHLFGRRVGLIAAFLMVINGFWVQYAQEARSYSLSILLLSMASLVFLKALESRKTSLWLLYGVIAGVAVYAHMLNGLLVAAHLTSLLFLPRERLPLKQVAGAIGLTAVISLPMALFVLSDSGQIDTTPPASLYRLVQVFYAQSGGHATLLDFVPGLTELPLLAYAAAGAMALWVLVRAWLADRRSEDTWQLLFVLSWLCVPVVLAVILSVHQSVLVPRYLVVIFPALVLWVSAGVGKFTPGAIGGLALAGLIAVSLVATASYFADYEKDDWRGASDFILDRSEAGDGILFYIPSTSLAFEYYESSEDRSIRPTAENYAFEAGTPEAERNPLYLGFGLPPEPDSNLAERLGPEHDRVWLLLAHAEDAGEVHGFADQIRALESELSSTYKMTLQKDFQGVSVLLYEQTGN